MKIGTKNSMYINTNLGIKLVTGELVIVAVVGGEADVPDNSIIPNGFYRIDPPSKAKTVRNLKENK